tara:strand:+ start:252 stop:1298 length:1047 start_codon:yes stop_codon:yes gene_type:complete
MAKINKPVPQDNIPVQESTHKGIPVTDVASAQRELLRQMENSNESTPEVEEEAETQDIVSEQATEEAQSVETETENSDELTVDDLVEDNQEEVNETPSTYTIRVDGKDVEVTLDELKNGYSRQADYTRKSQVLAEQRKRIDEELAATQQERQQYLSQLQQLQTQGQSELQKYQDTDWSKLKQEDPMEYMTQRDAYRELQESQREIQMKQTELYNKQQQEQLKQFEQNKRQNFDDLVQRIPEWADAEKGPKLKLQIKEYAVSKGFTAEELGTLIDSRSIDVLHKAMKYENLLKSKIEHKKTKVVPKVTKPGTGTNKADVSSERVKQQKSRLKRTGKVDDAAKLLESLMS